MDLHASLATLAPLDEAALPDAPPELPGFLEDAFSAAADIIDTLPIPPPPPPAPATITIPGRPRSVSVASALSYATNSSSTSASDASQRLTITPSAARPSAPALPSPQSKDWKEVKPSGPNPHDFRVYKLASRDGNGAWFARRSVHEGIGFARFRRGLRRGFEESLHRRRGVGREPAGVNNDTADGGDGWNGMVIPAGVRGIGAERRLEQRVVKGVGRIDVYHLSAQFPGPSAPRDFVAACISSSAASPPRTAAAAASTAGRTGREFTMVSRPLTHPDVPEQPGFVRGRYESIEFIREIIPSGQEADSGGPRRSMSVSDLTARAELVPVVEKTNAIGRPMGRPRSRTVGEPPRKPVAVGSAETGKQVLPRAGASNLRVAMSADELPDSDQEEARRGPTVVVSPADEGARAAEDEDGYSVENEEGGESNPIEWIMLTRSDPGGSVPRFMVERGTPGSILRDAEKFLDWACEMVHQDDGLSEDEHDEPEPEPELEPGAQVGGPENPAVDGEELQREISLDDSASNLSFMTASSGERGRESEDDGEQEEGSGGSLGSSQTTAQVNGLTPLSGSATQLLEDPAVNGSRARSDTAASTASSAAIQRMQTGAERAAERVRTAREKDDRKAAIRLAKEEEKQRKLEEKHAREAARREEKFAREQAKAEEKRRREEEKIQERKRRLEERDEKVRQERQIEDLKGEVELLRRENDVLMRENEALKRDIGGLKAKFHVEAAVNGGEVPSPLFRSASSLVGMAPREISPTSSLASNGGRRKKSTV
ncbi:hypothetical protein DRE_07728 [Drechslerella stenobrocha 248]|uniref:DUF3074 domain-containing protein n=1 Tax=Drechslerella stenobrocha 248 TaxID=1043628 RepID=W7I896_9PEZI|nr:hypothetical protein DRE_07728 [Drechslerella stenobrocha 248]